MITIEFLNHPTPEEADRILSIYHRQEWLSPTIDDPQRIIRVVDGSHCYVTARDKGTIIGIGRALSDGVGDAYIHDITVMKSHRNQGIGRRIVELIIDRLKRDGITWIGLIAEKGSPSLYKKVGFAPLLGALPMFRFDCEAPAIIE